MVQTPHFNLPDPCIDPQEGVNRFGARDKADGPQHGEGRLQLLPKVCGPPLLAPAPSGSLISIWMRGGGSKPFAQSTTSSTSRPPVYMASSSVCRRRGRARKWAWVSGRLPCCCEKAIAR